MENASCINLGGTEPKKNGRHKMKAKQKFDTTLFLSKIGKGRTMTGYKQKGMIFAQGDPADALFYIQEGKVKLTVVSQQGKSVMKPIMRWKVSCAARGSVRRRRQSNSRAPHSY